MAAVPAAAAVAAEAAAAAVAVAALIRSSSSSSSSSGSSSSGSSHISKIERSTRKNGVRKICVRVFEWSLRCSVCELACYITTGALARKTHIPVMIF